MSKELNLRQNYEINVLSSEKIDLLKKTVCESVTNDELQLFLHVCTNTGLDPFLKQIYCIVRGSIEKNNRKMTIQTSIDGLRLIAERTGKYSPGKEPLYKYDSQNKLISATAFVKKMTNDGTWHEVAATAIFCEYDPSLNNNFWKKMPHIMLAKCAEALALRKAFPAEMSGVVSDDEMAQAAKIEVTEIENESALSISSNKSEPVISQEQLIELENTIENDDQYRNKLISDLSSNDVPSLSKIPSKWYNVILKRAKEHAAARMVSI